MQFVFEDNEQLILCMDQIIRSYQQQDQSELTLEEQIPLKDYTKPYYYTLIICLSTLYSGYSITMIASCNINALKTYYNIDLSDQSTLSLLNGVLPAGGMLGAILVPTLVSLTTKKKSIRYLALASTILCGFSLIPYLFVLVLSRFFLGVLNGFQMSLASAYIKQIFPAYIRKPLGGVYSTCRVLGMLTCFVIAEIAGYTTSQVEHVLIFMGPALISALQFLLFHHLMPDSIVQMITRHRQAQAKQDLALFYTEQNIPRRYTQMKMEIAAAIKRTNTFYKIKLANRKNLCSLHLAVLRHFCGETYIVIYARQVMKFMKSPYANVTPAIVNTIQLVAGLLGIIAVQKVSRFRLLVGSSCLLALLNMLIGITDYYNLPVSCLIAMAAFMMPNGVGLSSVAWSYPSELVPASQGKYSSFVNWMCSTMVAMIPPYIVQITPNQSAYPVFFFFTLYLMIAFFINLAVLPRIDRPIWQNERTILINFQ